MARAKGQPIRPVADGRMAVTRRVIRTHGHLVEALAMRGAMIRNGVQHAVTLEARLADTTTRAEAAERERDELRAKLALVAKLAATTPQFSNPIIAWEAERIRDDVLTWPESQRYT
jgi:hypothetical protein